MSFSLVMEILRSGHGDNRVPKLDYMLWHKYIGFENGENCDNSNYCWEKMLEYGRA